MSAPKYNFVPDKAEIMAMKRDVESLRQKLYQKLKDKEQIKKAALIIEEMMKDAGPKKDQKK